MNTCWITLDDTRAYQGTIEYVRGSHKWPISPRDPSSFMARMIRLNDLYPAAAAAGVADYDMVPIEVPAGSCVIHHGRTWHGRATTRVTGRAGP